jgi:uncharacterized membrane protein YesL
MAGKIKGFIGRLIMGSEKSEGYARASLPSNRWELFWDILKGRFGKLVIINLLIFIFFLPLLGLMLYRSLAFMNYGVNAPFGQPFGVGFQAVESLVGFPENISLTVNLVIYSLMPIACAIAAIGVAGGAYVIRNMVWTEGIFVANDFWKGIRQNIGRLIPVALIYGLVFFLVNVSISFANQMIAMGEGTGWLLTASVVVAYIVLVFYSIMTLHMITMVVTYKVKFWQMFKNAFKFTIGLLFQNVFFALCALVPCFIILLGGMGTTIGLLVIVFIGLAWALLVWTDYSQWIYDSILDSKTRGMQKNKGIYEKIKDSDSEALKQYKEQMYVRSALTSRPIKPITDDELKLAELPTSFNRSDLENLRKSKEAIYEDHQKYVEEHKDDPEFMPTEEEKAFEERQKEREERVEKAKRELAKRNKNK